MEQEKNLIEKTIEEKYGSTNKFVESNYETLGISRTHLYALVMHKINNPGVRTLEQLALVLGLPKEDVINDYLNRYRDRGFKD